MKKWLTMGLMALVAVQVQAAGVQKESVAAGAKWVAHLDIGKFLASQLGGQLKTEQIGTSQRKNIQSFGLIIDRYISLPPHQGICLINEGYRFGSPGFRKSQGSHGVLGCAGKGCQKDPAILTQALGVPPDELVGQKTITGDACITIKYFFSRQ